MRQVDISELSNIYFANFQNLYKRRKYFTYYKYHLDRQSCGRDRDFFVMLLELDTYKRSGLGKVTSFKGKSKSQKVKVTSEKSKSKFEKVKAIFLKCKSKFQKVKVTSFKR